MERLTSELKPVFEAVNNSGVVKEFREQASALLVQKLVVFLDKNVVPGSWRTYKNKGLNKVPGTSWGQFVKRIEERAGY